MCFPWALLFLFVCSSGSKPFENLLNFPNWKLPYSLCFSFIFSHGHCAGLCGRYFFPFLFVRWSSRESREEPEGRPRRFSSGRHTGPLSAPLQGRGLCQHRTTHWAPISPIAGTGTVSTKRGGTGAGDRKGRPSTSGPLGCPSARQNNWKVLELGIARGARPRADPLDSPAQALGLVGSIFFVFCVF